MEEFVNPVILIGGNERARRVIGIGGHECPEFSIFSFDF